MNLEKQLSRIIARNWWVLLLRGLAAIAFGILAMLQPGISLAALVLLFVAGVRTRFLTKCFIEFHGLR